MSCGPSQADRILAALRSGPFAATDFAAPNIRDGLAPIFRVAARIGELRDQGYEITTGRLPSGVAVYSLTSDVGARTPPPVVLSLPAAALFSTRMSMRNVSASTTGRSPDVPRGRCVRWGAPLSLRSAARHRHPGVRVAVLPDAADVERHVCRSRGSNRSGSRPAWRGLRLT
jgi:hypothetical protein